MLDKAWYFLSCLGEERPCQHTGAGTRSMFCCLRLVRGALLEWGHWWGPDSGKNSCRWAGQPDSIQVVRRLGLGYMVTLRVTRYSGAGTPEAEMTHSS